MAIVFQDSFTVSVDTNLEAYPSGAPDYERALGSQTFIVKADVDNVNTIVGADGDTVYRVINPAVPTVDQQITITVTREAGAYKTIGPCVRCTTDNCYALVPSTEAAVELYRVTNGTFTLLTTFAIANAAGVHTYSLKAEGSGATVTLSAWVDGGTVYTYADTAADRKLSGTPGIWKYYNWQGMYFDDVVIDDTLSALTPISNTTNQQWNLFNSVSNLTDQRWDILSALTPISNTTNQQWNLFNSVSNLTDQRWDILSALTVISNTTNQQWNIIGNFLYYTLFDGSENPLSEGGDWQNNTVTWPPAKKVSGNAHATGVTVDYKDNCSYLKNIPFPNDYEIVAEIYLGDMTGWNVTASHEVEMLLRVNEGTDTLQLYEVYLGIKGDGTTETDAKIVRWNGPYNDWTILSLTVNNVIPHLVNGDIARARVSGSTISLFVNDVLVRQAIDSTILSGVAGIGFNNRDTLAVGDLFGFADFKVVGINTVSNNTNQQWNLFEEVSNQNNTQWSILNSISNNVNSVWNLLNSISNSSILQWNVYEEINNTLQTVWDILSALTPISNTTNQQWDIHQNITNSIDFRWDLLEAISNLTDQRWDILSALTAISNTTNQQWNLFEEISNQNNLQWDVLEEINNTFQSIWDLFQEASNTSNTQWDLFQETANTLQTVWDIISSLTAVSNTTDLQWNSDGRISQTIQLRWNLLTEISNQIDSQWDLLEELGVTTNLKWNILNEVAQQVTAQWDSFENTTSTLRVQWDSAGRVGNAVSIKWSILNLQGVLPLEIIIIPAEGRVIRMR